MRSFFVVLYICMIPVAAVNAQTNLVTNGDFSQGMTDWVVGNWSGGGSTYGVTNGVFSDQITATGTAAWNVFFYHFQDIKFKAGVNYIYSFTSHATAASTITTQVKTVGQPPAAPIWFSDSAVSIGLTDSTYSFPFTTTADDDSGQINYMLGFGNVPIGQTIYIKNVSIVESATRTVSNKCLAPEAEFVRVNGNRITVNLVNPANAVMKLFSTRGTLVADYTSSLKSMPAGSHQIGLNVQAIPSGMYLLSINDGSRAKRATVSLVK